MKFRNLKKRVATFGVVSALSVLCLSYQNCSRPTFAIDEAMKDKVLGETPVFGDERDPGVDPSAGGGRDPGVDPVTGMPRDPGVDPVTGMPRDPGIDPVTGMPRDPAIDPVTGMPRDPAIDPVTGMPRDPGTDPVTGMPRDPGKDPVTGMPRDPGADPVTGMPRDPGADPVTGMPRDPGADPNAPKPRDPGTESGGAKTVAKFEFACPLGLQAHGAYKAFADAGEVKAVVVTESANPNVADKVCEIPDVRAQIISKRQIDVSKCIDKKSFDQSFLYIVEKTVTSKFEKYTLTVQNGPFNDFLPIQIGYTEMDDKARIAACDQLGDPLLVQLKNDGKPQPISLTSAERGVMFDLLGKKNNYEKVQTAWFADNLSENYFLVLPDSKGQVKGIDNLFGDNTFGPDGKFSKQGFAALAKHDENSDQVISGEDNVFLSLRLWKDNNLDGVAQADELSTLVEKGVVAIDIKIDRNERRYLRTDSHGNQTKYRSVVVMQDGQYGLVYDLWLRYIAK